jgi:hypothetical protein
MLVCSSQAPQPHSPQQSARAKPQLHRTGVTRIASLLTAGQLVQNIAISLIDALVRGRVELLSA